MYLARLLVVLSAAVVLAPAVSAQAGPSGVLAVSPAPRLAYDAGLGERAEPLDETAAAGPRERGAWRGAKRGFLIGVGVGAVAPLATYAIADKGNRQCEYVCFAVIPAVMTVPLVALTTTAGAITGSINAGGPVPIQRP